MGSFSGNASDGPGGLAGVGASTAAATATTTARDGSVSSSKSKSKSSGGEKTKAVKSDKPVKNKARTSGTITSGSATSAKKVKVLSKHAKVSPGKKTTGGSAGEKKKPRKEDKAKLARRLARAGMARKE